MDAHTRGRFRLVSLHGGVLEVVTRVVPVSDVDVVVAVKSEGGMQTDAIGRVHV